MRFIIFDVIDFIINTTGISLLELHFIVDIASVITILALCYVINSLVIRSMLYHLFISQLKD